MNPNDIEVGQLVQIQDFQWYLRHRNIYGIVPLLGTNFDLEMSQCCNMVYRVSFKGSMCVILSRCRFAMSYDCLIPPKNPTLSEII